MKNLWIILLAVIILLGGWLYIRNNDMTTEDNKVATTTNNVVINPGSNGSTSTPVATSTANDTRTSDIIITSPLRGQTISSPLTLTGLAKGSWYFEASAPVLLTDLSGKVLAQTHIEAQGDWMTTNFVPFKGTLTWSSTSTGTSTQGYVVFQNDNPSGNPALQKSVKVPVTISR